MIVQKFIGLDRLCLVVYMCVMTTKTPLPKKNEESAVIHIRIGDVDKERMAVIGNHVQRQVPSVKLDYGVVVREALRLAAEGLKK